MEHQLEDFESFLESDFNKYKFTNDLLLATNAHDCTTLDIETPIKKLTFDLDEVETRMTKLVSEHYEEFIGNIDDIKATNDAIKSKINPSIARVNSSYTKINDEVIKPFEQSHNINHAIRKIHICLDLLRSSNFLFLLVLQITDLETIDDDNRKSNDIIQLCKLYNQASILLDKDTDHETPLTSLKLVREYQPIHSAKHKQLMTSVATTINNEFNHTSLFLVSNTNLRNNLIAYYILNPSDMFGVIDRTTISKQVQLTLNILTKSIQSPRNFNQILNETHQESVDYLAKLAKVLAQCEVTNDGQLVSLNDVISSDLAMCFWDTLVAGFEKSLAASMGRGGPVAKNLKIYYQGIKNSFVETFDGDVLQKFLKAVEIIQK